VESDIGWPKTVLRTAAVNMAVTAREGTQKTQTERKAARTGLNGIWRATHRAAAVAKAARAANGRRNWRAQPGVMGWDEVWSMRGVPQVQGDAMAA
jgi:hypothetical protein